MTMQFAESVLEEKLSSRLTGASSMYNFVDAVIGAANKCGQQQGYRAATLIIGDYRADVLPFLSAIRV